MSTNEILAVNLDVTPKRDVVFKLIFGSAESETILKDFLESILDIQIQSLSLDLSTELLPDFYEGKQSRVDVRTVLADGTQVNIEMQTKASGYSEQRCLQHWSKLYSNQLLKGHQYTDLSKTICVWILNEDIFPEHEDFESKWEIVDKNHPDVDRFNDLEFHFFELQKFRKCDKLEPTKKNLWLWFIDHTNWEMIQMGTVTNKEIAKARKMLDKIRSNPELMERIRLEEAYELDVNTAISYAEKQGLEQGIIKIATNLKKKGIPYDVIAETTRFVFGGN